jgi:hypothetical protein
MFRQGVSARIGNDFRELSTYDPQVRMYHFPPIKELPLTFQSIEHINDVLDIALRNYNQKTLPNNRIEKSLVLRETEEGVILKCKMRGCGAFLTFRKENGQYYIIKMETEHEHRLRANHRGRLPKVQSTEVEECYDELQLLNFKPREIVEYIRNRFKISKPHFYGIKFCRNKRDAVRNMLLSLSKYDHFFF